MFGIVHTGKCDFFLILSILILFIVLFQMGSHIVDLRIVIISAGFKSALIIYQFYGNIP